MSDGGRTRSRVRVVVADDHPLYRDGVVRALSSGGEVDVVAEVSDGVEALLAIREHAPDVAVLDYDLPELDGVAVAGAVQREDIPTRVLILSAFDESGLVYRALQSGAAGFLLKEARRNEILDGVLACARGDAVLPPDLTGGIVSEIRSRARSDAPKLTGRENEILRSIAAGRSLPEIAGELHLGVATVKTHARHLYQKLGVSDRAAAVAEAMRQGLIE
jgi:two-component system, NarL family, nitrate/nitrite response regulator NarL